MFNTGQKAVEAWQRSHHDVILMDVEMRDMDGVEVTTHIRSLYDLPQPYVIAYTVSDDRKACIAAGMDGYLRKPVTMDSFGAAIDEALTAAAARRNEYDLDQLSNGHNESD